MEVYILEKLYRSGMAAKSVSGIVVQSRFELVFFKSNIFNPEILPSDNLVLRLVMQHCLGPKAPGLYLVVLGAPYNANNLT